jgi:hypothetical protein
MSPGNCLGPAHRLGADRDGNDQDGRKYTITVTGQDKAGNIGTCSTAVTVPHDQENLRGN